MREKARERKRKIERNPKLLSSAYAKRIFQVRVSAYRRLLIFAGGEQLKKGLLADLIAVDKSFRAAGLLQVIRVRTEEREIEKEGNYEHDSSFLFSLIVGIAVVFRRLSRDIEKVEEKEQSGGRETELSGGSSTQASERASERTDVIEFLRSSASSVASLSPAPILKFRGNVQAALPSRTIKLRQYAPRVEIKKS